jgi:hypothetical protein
MMPCQTAAITDREIRQVTDGNGPVGGMALCGREDIFCCVFFPSLMQGPHRSALSDLLGTPIC